MLFYAPASVGAFFIIKFRIESATGKGEDCFLFGWFVAKMMTDNVYAHGCVTINGVEYHSETINIVF